MAVVHGERGGGVANGGEHPDFIFIFHNGQILVENNDIEDMIFEFFFLEDKKSYYFRFVFYTIWIKQVVGNKNCKSDI